MIANVNRLTDEHWLENALACLNEHGYVLVENVLSAAFLDEAKKELLTCARDYDSRFGEEKTGKGSSQFTYPFPMGQNRFFQHFLEIEEMLQVVERYLLPTAVLRFQNAMVYRPGKKTDVPPANSGIHQNFPHIQSFMPCSLEVAFVLTAFRSDAGSLLVVPGSHRYEGDLSEGQFLASAVQLKSEAGTMLLMDGSTWHLERQNMSDEPLLAVGQQFTHPIVRQHFDYCSLLGEEQMRQLPERTRQILGYYVRTPSSLEDYYAPEELRSFRCKQLTNR